MYPKKAFSTREQDYGALLRQKLEEAEVMLYNLNPSRERGLALDKLDECLLWANVSIAGAGISQSWRAPHEKPVQKIVVKEPEWSNSHFGPYFGGDKCVTAEEVLKETERSAAAGTDTTSQELSKLENAASKEKVDDSDYKPKDNDLQAELADAVHDGMQVMISSTDETLHEFPELEKAARAWKTLLDYTPDVNNWEEFRAWLREVVKCKKCAAAVKKFYEQWTEEKKAPEAHQNE